MLVNGVDDPGLVNLVLVGISEEILEGVIVAKWARIDEMTVVLELPDATTAEEEKPTGVAAIGILKTAKFAATGLTCDLCVYRLNLFPFPQICRELPAQGMLHSLSSALRLAEDSRTLSHQHSLPYSNPTYLYSEHA